MEKSALSEYKGRSIHDILPSRLPASHHLTTDHQAYDVTLTLSRDAVTSSSHSGVTTLQGVVACLPYTQKIVISTNFSHFCYLR